ncbi:MAG: SLC13 family permease [Verrucomicrobiota bacterium]
METHYQIAIVLGLLVIGVILFSLEVLSVDIITLLLLIALVIFQILPPDEAFAGFSSDIIIILASIFIISGALQRTGFIDAIGHRVLSYSGQNVNRFLLLMMSVVGGFSAFMNNTTVTALFLSPVLGVAKKLKISPSKLLIPLAYASILGGTCTLIGTSTNIAVSGYIKKIGLQPIGLFEMTGIGLIILGVGIAFMMTIGKRLLPDYPDESLTKDYNVREYLSEIIVTEGSHLLGQKVFESDLAKLEFQIIGMMREGKNFVPTRRTVIRTRDILLVEGKIEELMKVKTTAGIEIKPEFKLDDPALQSDDVKIAEVLINPRSDLIGRSLKDISFRQRFGLTVIALYRHGRSRLEKLGHIRLRLGDLLLVQGATEAIDFLRRNPSFTIIEEVTPPSYQKKKGWMVAGFFVAAMLAGTVGWIPLPVAFLSAAVLTLICRCLRVEDAYTFIDWRLLILIGGMTAFGVAMEKTGTAEFLADWIVHFLEPLGAKGIMAGFFVLTILLTQPMSNAAAALVVLPVALKSAQALQVNQRTFAIAIMLAASISFITPLEPSCILVYGPGKYRFIDFVKTGIWLTLILVVVIFFAIPYFWPLEILPTK